MVLTQHQNFMFTVDVNVITICCAQENESKIIYKKSLGAIVSIFVKFFKTLKTFYHICHIRQMFEIHMLSQAERANRRNEKRIKGEDRERVKQSLSKYIWLLQPQ